MKDFQINQGWIILSGSLAIGLLISPNADAISSTQAHPLSDAASDVSDRNALTAANQDLPGIFKEILPIPNQNLVPQPLTTPLSPPLPEQRQPVNAIIALDNGTAQVELVNLTNAAIDYIVVDHTNQRLLPGQSNVTLRALPAPVVVNFQRQDGGLLDVQVRPTDTPGVLQVTLDESTDFSAHRISMKIQDDGAVFLN